MRIVAEFEPVICVLTPWRAVEATHRVATMVLVDSLAEQAILERELDDSKPARADQQPGLHWLIFTPFRYPPLPSGSRFRGPGQHGVFYGADSRKTACVELGYWRWRFLMDSPNLVTLDPMPQTLFQSEIRGLSIDLRAGKWASRENDWMHPVGYAPTQEIARQARKNDIQVIRYASVRDPERGACAAILNPIAFSKNEPVSQEGWMLSVSTTNVFWKSNSVFGEESFEFKTVQWRMGKSLE